MIITVPRALMIYPPGYGGNPNEQLTIGLDAPGLPASSLGLSGLGQDDTTDSGGGFDWNALTKAITAAATTTAAVIKSNQQPYVIPGTPGAVYSPATGQFVTQQGTTFQQAGMSWTGPIVAGVVVLALVLVVAMKGK
jgi:hypothetical protein